MKNLVIRIEMARFNSSDDRVVKTSSSKAVDSGLITSRIRSMTLKLAGLFTASPLDAQH